LIFLKKKVTGLSVADEICNGNMSRQAAYRWRKFIQGATENSGASKPQKTQSTFDLCQVFGFDDAQGTPSTIKEHEFQVRCPSVRIFTEISNLSSVHQKRGECIGSTRTDQPEFPLNT
jgi:hypothetical protein